MSVLKYYVEFQKCAICCGIEEDPENKVCRFYGGLRHEIQDIVYYKDFNTTNQLFQLAMLAEKELQDINKRTRPTLATTSTGFSKGKASIRENRDCDKQTSGHFHRYNIFTITSHTHFGAW
jgi:hypothetical protein